MVFGADNSFIDIDLVKQINISLVSLPKPKEVLALDGRLISTVTNCTAPISLMLSGNHTESIELSVIASPTTPVVLGLPWLKLRNPVIDWSTSSLTSWSGFCHQNCLKSDIPTGISFSQSPPKDIDLSAVPSAYHDLKQVLSKDRALSLPSHRPYDYVL